MREPSRQPVWSGACLLVAGAFGVHQLRYLLAYGPAHARSELAEQGHSYLDSLAPWIALALAAALGAFLGRLARAWREGPVEGERPSLIRHWCAASAGLVSVYPRLRTPLGAAPPAAR